MTTIIAIIVTWFTTLIVPHIRTQISRSKEFKRQEFKAMIEQIVDERLKNIIND